MADDAPTNVTGFTNAVPEPSKASFMRYVLFVSLLPWVESGTRSRLTLPSGGRNHEAKKFAASVIKDPDVGATETFVASEGCLGLSREGKG
ncbi:hypothetical protein LIER_28510 [Lithospermum erythrorhizon]|uniref:Uncharacterized protein n=1 Tax=Lithospermum erythrorhizon TaxID=34254 RepID=A0AAV3RJC7_LITER